MAPKKTVVKKQKKMKVPSVSDKQMDVMYGMGMTVLDATEKIPLFGTGMGVRLGYSGTPKITGRKVVANRGMYSVYDTRVILR
jgi:hypothetical protein